MNFLFTHFHFHYSNSHHTGQFGTRFSFGFQTPYISYLFGERLLTPVRCCDLIFITNICKRTSKFACIQSWKSVSWRHLTGKMSLQLCYKPIHRKISSTKDNNDSNNKLSLFFQRPQCTLGLVGWQDCKHLHLSTAFLHHSHRLPGHFWGQKLKSLLLLSKIQTVAKAKDKSVLIVLFIAGIQRS